MCSLFPIRSTACLLAILASLAFTPALHAQESDTDTKQPVKSDADADAKPPTVDALVKQLNADDYATREAASRALLADESLSLDRLAELYRAAGTFEQQWRLEAVAMHHFVRRLLADREPTETDSKSGVLGITIAGEPVDATRPESVPGVRVMATLPGLPAHAQLVAGDLVVSVDGKDIDHGTEAEITTRFRETILTKKTGQTVRLTVLREGKRVSTKVTLGRYDDLQQVYTPSETGSLELAEPYRSRWRSFQQEKLGKTVEPDPQPEDPSMDA